MDNFAQSFRQILIEYPDVKKDRKLLKGILSDVFPQEQREINLLLTGFDLDAMSLITGPADTLFIRKSILKNRMMKEHGIASAYAAWAVDTWLFALGDDSVECPSSTLPPISEEEFAYYERDGGMEIVLYKGSQASVTVPATLNGKPVTIIGERAFRDNQSVVRVLIEPGISMIRGGAFSGCTNLQDVSFPDTLVEIGELKSVGKTPEDGAFFGTAIKEISIPGSVKVIGAYTFANCLLETVTLPDTVEELGKGTFEECKNLVSIKFPAALYCVPNSILKKCVSLKDVQLPIDAHEIEKGAFSGCQSLTSLELPYRLAELESSTFTGCKSLKKLYIPHTVTRISTSNAYDSYINTYTSSLFGNSTKINPTLYCHPKSFARKFAKAFKMSVADWDK